MHAAGISADLIYSELRYDDAAAGVAFLTRAFGFEPQHVVRDTGGRIARATLRIGSGSILVGSANPNETDFRTPNALDGISTGSIYVALPDVDVLHAQAEDAGARIIHPPADTDYGSRDFSAVDPEGFLWFFGTYHPAADGTQLNRDPGVFTGSRYADARTAIAWLGTTFGFEEQFVVPGDGDDIAHAQLRFGDSLMMLGSARTDEYNLRTPRELHGAFTHKFHVHVPDPDAHYAHVRAANADIVLAPAATSAGGRAYSVRDPEGYVWTFGTSHPALVP